MEMDTRMFWKYIKRHKHQQGDYHVIKDDDVTYVQPVEKAEVWRKYFQKKTPVRTNLNVNLVYLITTGKNSLTIKWTKYSRLVNQTVLPME